MDAERENALGLARGKVALMPHDGRWAKAFDETRTELQAILGGNVLAIHHTGSTAIAGILAKPILDVAVVLRSIEDMNIAGMEAAGFEYCGEHGIEGRHFFVRRAPGGLSTHHIHCYLADNDNLRGMLLFGDYLNAHPETARAYDALKISLAQRYPEDRGAYTDGKEAFITEVIARAKGL